MTRVTVAIDARARAMPAPIRASTQSNPSEPLAGVELTGVGLGEPSDPRIELGELGLVLA